MIADTIADVEGNHRAKPHTNEIRWINHIDRTWLEQILYNELGEVKPSSTPKEDATNVHDHAGIREMLRNSGRTVHRTVAAVLADADNIGWIINCAPFPMVKRQPRAGEVFCLKTDYPSDGGKYLRTFLGRFVMTGALKRRRMDSPPAEAKPTKKRKTRFSERIQEKRRVDFATT